MPAQPATVPMLKSSGSPSDQPLLACDWIRDKDEPTCNGAVHYISTGKHSPSPPLHLFKGKKGLWQIAPEVDAAVAYAVAKSPASHPNTVVEGEWLVPTPPDGSWQLHKDFNLKHDGPNSEEAPYTMDDLGADFFLRVKNNKLIWFIDPATGEVMHSGAKAAGSQKKPGQRFCPLCRKCFSANNFVSQHVKNLHTPPPPGAPICSGDDKGGAKLTWTLPTFPPGARPVGYAVQFSLDNGATWTTAVENSGSPEPTARVEPASLIGGRSYTFRVAIHTLATLGAYSPSSTPFFVLRKSSSSADSISDGIPFVGMTGLSSSSRSSESSVAAFANAIDTPLAPSLTTLSSASFDKGVPPFTTGAPPPVVGSSTGSSPRSSSVLPTPPVSPPPSLSSAAAPVGSKRTHSMGVDSQYGSYFLGSSAASTVAASSVASSPTYAMAPGAPPGMLDDDDDQNLMWTLDEIISCASAESSPTDHERKKVRHDAPDTASGFGTAFAMAPRSTAIGGAPPPPGGGGGGGGGGEHFDLNELLAQFGEEPAGPVYRSITPDVVAVSRAATAPPATASPRSRSSSSSSSSTKPKPDLTTPSTRIVQLRHALAAADPEQLSRMITPQVIAKFSKAGWTREVTLLISYAPPEVANAAMRLKFDDWGPVERAELRQIISLFNPQAAAASDAGSPRASSASASSSVLAKQKSAPSLVPSVRHVFGPPPVISLRKTNPFGSSLSSSSSSSASGGSWWPSTRLLVTIATAAVAALAAATLDGGAALALSAPAPACHFELRNGCVPSNARTTQCSFKLSNLFDAPCSAS